MLRWYLVIVVVAVAVGSQLGRGPEAKPDSEQTATVSTANHDIEVAAADAGSFDPLDRSIELTRDTNGYFYADVQINGAPLHMLVDTGASGIALSRDDARLAGIATAIAMDEVVGEGADGAVRGQPVMLDTVTLGDKTATGLPAVVLNSGGQSLLGQSFLSRFASVHIEGDRMILR
jgi:aspartyl protease family protein